MSLNHKTIVTGEAESDALSSVPTPVRSSRAQTGHFASLKCIFSVDVEDWFHILDVPSAPPLAKWDSLPSRVEKNFMGLLDLFREKNALVTCFFLGWVARQYPHLVREAASRGHEIASHGYSHELVYRLKPQEFLKDAIESKRILEDLIGKSVRGYRSSGFSVTEDTPWFFEMLVEAGYRYDSSVFPVRRGHGGFKTAPLAPYLVPGCRSSLIEFPITVEKVLGMPMCFFGGGYLRLFPYGLIRRMTYRVLSEGRPVVFYVHPREIDPEHPRLPMGALRKFKSYVNLASTEGKIRRLTSEFEITTFETLIRENPEAFKN